MSEPVRMTGPVRLDDLIEGITKVHGDVLDQLAEAVITADHLGTVADALIGYFVDQARRSGASWTEIGRSMGVTKQAAQKRFVTKAPAEGGDGQGFSRFSERARNAVITAHNEARAAGNDRIAPAHLLLGLVRDDGAGAAKALAALGVTAEAARQAASAALPAPAGEVPAIIPFDEGARAALEGAFAQAERLGYDQVGSEHVLLSLLDVEGGSGPLAALGVTPSGVEARIPTAG
jgi:hypothetical protein